MIEINFKTFIGSCNHSVIHQLSLRVVCSTIGGYVCQITNKTFWLFILLLTPTVSCTCLTGVSGCESLLVHNFLFIKSKWHSVLLVVNVELQRLLIVVLLVIVFSNYRFSIVYRTYF